VRVAVDQPRDNGVAADLDHLGGLKVGGPEIGAGGEDATTAHGQVAADREIIGPRKQEATPQQEVAALSPRVACQQSRTFPTAQPWCRKAVLSAILARIDAIRRGYTAFVAPRYVPEDSMLSPRFTGPSTFARLPYVRDLADVDLAVVGVPFDTGVTYRVGGRFGPNAVRAASVMLRPYNANLDVKPLDVLSCVDYGDVAIVPGYTERSYQAIEATVAPIVEAGIVPLLIGGDHACTLPHLRATRSRGPVAVIDFDSHTDAWDSYFGEKYNHGTWMRRAIEEGLVDVARSIEVGLRGSLYDAGDWTVLRTELGLEYLTTEDVLRLGPEEVADVVRRRVGAGPAFISFDIDVVDPAFAPGTGTPEAGGPSAHDLLAVLRGLTGIDFVGFDVVEVIPAYDPAGQTATLACNIAFEMLSLSALRRRSR
jgi:agmatinase